jgi:hypothetical protein
VIQVKSEDQPLKLQPQLQPQLQFRYNALPTAIIVEHATEVLANANHSGEVQHVKPEHYKFRRIGN